MSTEKEHINIFSKEFSNKKNPFKTPENYFDNLSERIVLNPIENKLPKETGFIAPNNYLEKFNVKKPKSKIVSLLPYLSTISVAAVIAFGFFVFKTNSPTEIELSNSDIINYLAMDETFDINDDIMNDLKKHKNISFSDVSLENISPSIDQISFELNEYEIIDF